MSTYSTEEYGTGGRRKRHPVRKFFIFLRRFFTLPNLRHGFKGVLADYRGFLPFFAALLVIQSMFWLPWMEYDLYADEAYKLSRDCNYNLITEGYTEKEWEEIYNHEFMIFDYQEPKVRGYISYTVDKYYGQPGQILVRLRFLLTDDSPEFAESFMNKYNLNGEAVKYTLGERTRYQQRIAQKKTQSIVSTVLVGVLGVVLLLILFHTRVEYFRFRFGIYMTFGADFNRLIGTSGWEMFAAAILSFVPAMGLSAFVFWGITGRFLFPGSFWRIVLALGWILCIILLSVFPSVKLCSRKTPMSLLQKADNGDSVTSPKVSFHIFGKRFPFHYELYGLWRFRKYYALLLAYAVLFTTVFSTGAFFAKLKKTEMEAHHPQYTIDSPYNGVDGDILDEIADIPGVDHLFWTDAVSATTISSHVRLDQNQARNMSGMTVSVPYNDSLADNHFRYCAMSERLYGQITAHNLWQIDGDVERVITDSTAVAVSLSVNNRKVVNLQPGDTITLADLLQMDTTVDFSNPDKRIVLEQLLVAGFYEYYPVTVAAVIDDGETGNEYSIYLNEELYAAITGKQALSRNISVWVKEDISIADAETVRDKLCAALSEVGMATVINNGVVYTSRLAKVCRTDRILAYISFCALLLSPLIWFYSQGVFMQKRQKELEMLTAFGGTDRRLLRLMLWSGGMLAILACAATGLLTTGLTYIAFVLVNNYFPSLGFGESIRYTYSFQLGAFLLSVAVSSLCAVISTVLPYLRYVRERDKLLARDHIPVPGKEKKS